jgi:hypothetical protein
MLDYIRDIRFMGALTIIISITTWVLELMHLVEVCPYCQTERTVIGILGILMVLPNLPIATLFLTIILGLFGTHVACAQIFMHTKLHEFTNMFTILATCALFIMTGQLMLLFQRALQANHCNEG